MFLKNVNLILNYYCKYLLTLLGRRDGSEAGNNGDHRRSVQPDYVRRQSFGTNGQVCIDCPCVDPGRHI